ncbi:CusA/CzcA family heavy metal efflux RND transporter [Aestuariibacter halophilus]|uniref:CusA/CzcA family heavy metal efflux RND transporter n=1 Tax=Fluctibacter halophilus TaxID=226011 RepID=A0ABS8GAB5_9ALTE|nr:CusA/CzcA family heavy metal efflux RND transporter [Aestuariibacter halophilus]MCC2617534.1 CusA/CzcA family heavy metal efflux RND transporter [Aestuariibacter halophilus]
MAALLRFALTQRVFVLIAAAVLMFVGWRAWNEIPIDAFPDISPTQVKIVIKAPGMTTTEVEAQITRPIELELLGIPRQEMLRSTTKYAITSITLDFEQGTDIYWARQQVNERLSNVWAQLPSFISGGVAPMSTPLSEMFMFTVDNPSLTLQQRRDLLDWTIRPVLRAVPGVAELNSLGGYVKTFEITPDVSTLMQLGLSQDDLVSAINDAHQNVGLGRMNRGVDTLIVRTQGRFETLDDIKALAVPTPDGRSIRLSEVATVSIGSLTRYGAVTKNGEEAVQGLVIALKGSNTAQVVADVKTRLADLQPSLPEGTTINVFYDRAELIDTAVGTITEALIEAVVLVIVLLALFLGNVRAALTVSLILPLAALSTFILMHTFDLTANLMSLGGLVIAIGMLVDASVVVVENVATHQQRKAPLPFLHVIFRASKEVTAPVVAGTIIVVVVFSPLFTLSGLEGKLFAPVALTIVFAMVSALILSLTVTPVIASWLMAGTEAPMPKYMVWLQQVFLTSVRRVLATPGPAIAVALVALVAGGYLFVVIGKSFMPTMDEGDIIVQFEKSPGINLDASVAIDTQAEKHLLATVPEVLQVVARTGSDELGLDPMGLNETDVFLQLKPRDEWRQGSKAELIDDIRAALAGYTGLNQNFTQPIQMRVSEMLTGTSGDVSIKVFGDDVETLAGLTSDIQRLVTKVQGSSDVQAAMIEGGQYLNIKPKPAVAAQLGVSVRSLADQLIVQLEGREIGQISQGETFIPLRLSASAVQNQPLRLGSIEDVRHWPVLLPNQRVLPLSDVADIALQEGPLLIEREQSRRFAVVTSNVTGRDVVGFVNELQSQIQQQITLPNGYWIDFGGEFENQQRAMGNLLLVVPVALLLIFVILFTTFRSVWLSLLILANIPFALVGGIASLYVSGAYLSVPASVGFIALLGVAVLNGVVMVSFLEQLRLRIADLTERVEQGAVRRLRPVLMTATTAMFGLFPLAFATGPGAEIQQPLAIVVIGGLVTSTLTTLYLLPVFYRLLEKRRG